MTFWCYGISSVIASQHCSWQQSEVGLQGWLQLLRCSKCGIAAMSTGLTPLSSFLDFTPHQVVKFRNERVGGHESTCHTGYSCPAEWHNLLIFSDYLANDDISSLMSNNCANANTRRRRRIINARTARPKDTIPRHAYPAAEEARPAAVGKLLTEQMWMCSSGWVAPALLRTINDTTISSLYSPVTEMYKLKINSLSLMQFCNRWLSMGCSLSQQQVKVYWSVLSFYLCTFHSATSYLDQTTDLLIQL